MRWNLFVKLKYESSTIILFVGVRYSMRDLPAICVRYGKWCQRFPWHQIAL